jgi:hypothetical protein
MDTPGFVYLSWLIFIEGYFTCIFMWNGVWSSCGIFASSFFFFFYFMTEHGNCTFGNMWAFVLRLQSRVRLRGGGVGLVGAS